MRIHFGLLLSSIFFLTQPLKNFGQKQTADLLISGGTIITVNTKMEVIENGAIAVKNGKIIALGKKNEIDTMYSAETQIYADGKLVVPGLINTHTHAAMTLLRGYADDMILDSWLQNKIWPAEAKIMNNESVKAGTFLAIAEMISAGVTCFNDMYYFQDAVAQAAKEANMRVVIGEGIIDYPSPEYKTPDEALEISEKLINKFKNDPLVSVAIAPHSPYTCSKETLKKVKSLVDKYDIPIHIHLSETEKEISDVMAMYDMRPPELLNSVGLLTAKTIAAHCICLNTEEIKMLSEKNVGVAHCPVSNMKLAEKVAPITPMLKLNMKVSFGTDGASSNNNLSILNEMRTGSLLQKVTYADPTVINAPTALRMATIEAAKVLGLENKIGSLEKDKLADIIIVNLDEPRVNPYYDPYSTILYSAEESDIEMVIINGKEVMKNGRLLTINKEKVIQDANQYANQLRNTDVKENNSHSLNSNFQLNQNYPNPFNPETTINYQLSVPGNVTLKVYDVLGREVTTLVNEWKQAGKYNSKFSIMNSQIASGIYFYKLQAGNYIDVKKMLLIR